MDTAHIDCWQSAVCYLQLSQGAYYFISILLTSTGLALGFIYFFGRLYFDYCKDRNERARSRFKLLIEFMEDYEDVVAPIVNQRLQDDKQIGSILEEATKRYERIQIFLESNENLLKLSPPELRALLEPHSLLEKSMSVVVKTTTAEALNKADLTEFREKFQRKQKMANKVCWARME